MLVKRSDIVIDTEKETMIRCPICKSYVIISEYDYKKDNCKNCNKDEENNDRTNQTSQP